MSVSSATVSRLLRPAREKHKIRGVSTTTSPGDSLNKLIDVRVYYSFEDRDAIVPRKAGSLSRYRAHRRHIRQFGGEDILVPFSSRPLTEFPSERCRKGPRLPIIPMLPRVFPEKAFSGAHIHSMVKRKITYWDVM